MIVADSLWPKINSGCGEDAVVEAPGQRRVPGMEASEFVNVFFIQFRRIRCKGTCKAKRLLLRRLWNQRVPTATKTSNRNYAHCNDHFIYRHGGRSSRAGESESIPSRASR